MRMPIDFKETEGAVSVLVLTGIVGLLSFLCVAGFITQALVIAQHLNNSADRIALAAAHSLVTNSDLPCVTASDFAAANEVLLTNCEVTENAVTVQVVTKSGIQSWLNHWQYIGSARAGLADASNNP